MMTSYKLDWTIILAILVQIKLASPFLVHAGIKWKVKHDNYAELMTEEEKQILQTLMATDQYIPDKHLLYGLIPVTEMPDDVADCVICLDSFEVGQRVDKLNCNHYYHRNCIEEWFKEKRKLECPICKQVHQVLL